MLIEFVSSYSMWTAKCSYVRNLYEPVRYAQALERMYNETLLHPTLGNTTYACLQPSEWRDSHTGLGRYASERWVYSHPDVRPVSSLGYTNVAKIEVDFVPRLVGQPRLRANYSPMRNRRYHTSFARLEGRLFEWNYLYNRRPKSDSWIWNYFKDYERGSDEYMAECEALANATRIMLSGVHSQ